MAAEPFKEHIVRIGDEFMKIEQPSERMSILTAVVAKVILQTMPPRSGKNAVNELARLVKKFLATMYTEVDKEDARQQRQH